MSLRRMHLWSPPRRGPICGTAYDNRSEDYKLVTTVPERIQCRRCWKQWKYWETHVYGGVSRRLADRFAAVLGARQ